MKRNLDLVRSILLIVEEAEGHLEIKDLFKARDRIKGCEFTDGEIIYHVELLIAHGFIDGKLTRDLSGEIIEGCINGLTWDGADFLESMRDNGVWEKAKDAIKRTVGSTTFDVVKQTCSLVAMQMIKTSIGM